MYSFASRPDCAVVDEPFYAAYLTLTGLKHPMRDEILASQPVDPKKVAANLVGKIPDSKPIFYQKHMAQHMLAAVPRAWMAECTNVFLIRHPARVVASFSAKYENPTLTDIGFVQQSDLFDRVKVLGGKPIVIDSSDIRQDPERVLKKLCVAIGLNWNASMLSWPKGGNENDGVWAPHWYGSVHASTGFAPAEGPLPELTAARAELAQAALPYFEKLSELKL